MEEKNNELMQEEIEERFRQDYLESLEENYEIEIEKCKGDMCMEYAEDDDTHLCPKCKKTIQTMFWNFIEQFNDEEKEYLLYYIKEREVL